MLQQQKRNWQEKKKNIKKNAKKDRLIKEKRGKMKYQIKKKKSFVPFLS